MNRRKKLRLLLIAALLSQPVLADSLSLKLGYTNGDITPDQHKYAVNLQNNLFNDKRLETYPISLNYHVFNRKIPKFFREKWVFSIGLNHASLLDSYPGGHLQLTRDTVFYQIGYRVEQDDWIAPLKMTMEICHLNGLVGRVNLKADTGSQTFREEFSIFDLTYWQAVIGAEYAIDSQYSLSLGAQVFSQAGLGILMGVHYEFQNKKN